MSNIRSTANADGLAVETTASFPNPAQDYYTGPLSLDRRLVRRPASTYVLRVGSDALASMGIRAGDEILVDRSLSPATGRVLVVLLDGELRLGRYEVLAGQATLVSDAEEVPLTAEVEPWGVATVLIHQLPLGAAAERSRSRAVG